jgi:CubicO group peptidase (beta-lactamase class C family)
MLNALTGAEAGHPVDLVYEDLNIARGAGYTLDTFVDQLGHVPLRFQPGTRWHYSLSTDVCGYLVQAISGKRFDRFLAEEIFQPLGMTDTGFHVRPENRSRFAACYKRVEDKSVQLADDPTTSTFLKEPSFFGGGGGLTGTIADYHRFCEMLRRGGTAVDAAFARSPGRRNVAGETSVPRRKVVVRAASPAIVAHASCATLPVSFDCEM